MKWEDFRQSDNIEVDCLGIRKEGLDPAVLSCQNELRDLRQNLVDSVRPSMQETAGKSFDGLLSTYINRKERQSTESMKMLKGFGLVGERTEEPATEAVKQFRESKSFKEFTKSFVPHMLINDSQATTAKDNTRFDRKNPPIN